MAGHSQFKNIMHRKGRQDAVESKLFGKLAREITVAAKLGLPDPAMNPRLRAAIIAARAENMPKDNIERAIKKAAGRRRRELRRDPLRGLRPGRRRGDRRGADRQPQPHRLRRALHLHQERRQSRRDRRGVVHVRPCRRDRIRRQGRRAPTRCWKRRSRPAPTTCVSDEGGHEVYATQESLRRRSPRRWRRSSASRARRRLTWKPQNTVAVDDEQGEKLLKLIETLERARRRAERLCQFRGLRRADAEDERVTGSPRPALIGCPSAALLSCKTARVLGWSNVAPCTIANSKCVGWRDALHNFYCAEQRCRCSGSGTTDRNGCLHRAP